MRASDHELRTWLAWLALDDVRAARTYAAEMFIEAPALNRKMWCRLFEAAAAEVEERCFGGEQ